MPAELFVIGMSHRTSPVELRERLAVEGEALTRDVRALREGTALEEALLLSTCNRVEVYASTSDAGRAARVREWLGRRAGEPLDAYLYEHRGAAAVRHAFRVASSLDSMVVGEPQILGQVKEAYAAAKAVGAIGSLLDRCFTTAFSVAKRVRSETLIAEGSVSVSSVAGDLAKKIFSDLEGRRVLLIGAGEMGEQAAKHLRKSGASLYVVNRSREKAEAIARENGGHARGLEELAAELALADVAIASTSSPRFVITPELMRGVIKARRHRPIFLIDIAVPRDVDPRVGDMDNVFLYDVDDLEKVAQENMSARRREAEKAEALVAEEVASFEKWRRSNDLTPTIVGLRERVRGVLRAELERTLPRLSSLSEAERQSLDKMIDAMTNKLLHRPIAELKAGADTPDGQILHDAMRRLFELDPKPAAEPPAVVTLEPVPAPRGKVAP
ncbi:MAG TPA: glutamyl-tRNA reductase [Sandaracinaceae bacterium]